MLAPCVCVPDCKSSDLPNSGWSVGVGGDGGLCGCCCVRVLKLRVLVQLTMAALGRSRKMVMLRSISFNMRKCSDVVIRVTAPDRSRKTGDGSYQACDDVATTFTRLSEEGGHVLLEIPMHTEILMQQSGYFNSLLSERWKAGAVVDDCSGTLSGSRPRPVVYLSCLTNVHHSTYEKCFKLMYQAHHEKASTLESTAFPPTTLLQVRFKDVSQALQVLQLSAHFLFTSGVCAALSYLQAVPWSAEERDSLSYLLLSLDLSSLEPALLEDLWARVNDVSACSNLSIRALVLGEWEKIFVDWKQRLQNMQNICVIQRSHSPSSNSGLPSPDETRAFCNRSIWLFERAIDLQVGHKALAVMTSDKIEFSSFLVGNVFQKWPGTSQPLQLRASAVVVAFFLVLLRLLEALERGEVICDCDNRCKFVCKWFTVIAHIFDKKVSCSSEDRNHFGKHSVCQVQMYVNSHRLFPDFPNPRYVDNLVNCKVDPKQAITEALEAVLRSLRPMDQQKILSLWIQSDILLNNRSAPILDLESSFKDFCEITNQSSSAP